MTQLGKTVPQTRPACKLLSPAARRAFVFSCANGISRCGGMHVFLLSAVICLGVVTVARVAVLPQLTERQFQSNGEFQ